MAACVAVATTANAQFVQTQSVGGVSIDTDGILKSATRDEIGKLQRVLAEYTGAVPEGLDQASDLRRISLGKIDAALREWRERGERVPVELEVLGGLQKIKYVLVYPEQHDIVLVGPGEGWTINAKGQCVGAASGRPVMLLDDLVVALRAVSHPQPSALSCSIDPSQEGLRRWQAFAHHGAGQQPGPGAAGSLAG